MTQCKKRATFCSFAFCPDNVKLLKERSKKNGRPILSLPGSPNGPAT